MTPYQVAAIAAVLALSGVGLYLHDRRNTARARRRLALRPQLGPEEFTRAHFGGGERRTKLAGEIHELIQAHLPYSVKGLAPGDSFVEDLRMDALDSMATVELVMDVEKKYGITIPNEDAARILTVQELVEYLERRLEAGQP